MPRAARVKGEFQTYHIVQRGNERKKIFLSDYDKIRFLDTLSKMKEKYNFNMEAFCLMDNHVHLLINDNGNDISKIVKSINISYAYYFNHAYKRIGHLFQDRFKSEVVGDDNYLLTVNSYIHNNPVKAGLVKYPYQYRWSSFNHYLGKEKSHTNLVDTQRILGIFSSDMKRAVEQYTSYVQKYEPGTEVLDIDEDIIKLKKENANYIESYEEALEYLHKELEALGKSEENLSKDRNLRCHVILNLRKNSCLSLDQIGKLAGGISKSMVCKILKNI